MKSANVTGLPIMGDMGVAPQRAVAKQDDAQKPALDFRQMMNRSIADGGQQVGNDRGNTATVREFAAGRKDTSSFESPTQDNFISKTDNNGQASGAVSDEMKENETFGEIEEAVEETVTEALGISEEQLEDAMEVLGLSMIDLLDPANMQALMQQVAEDVPTMDMNLLAITPQELVGSLEDAIAPILSEADLVPEEMGYLLTELVPTDDPAIAGAFGEILEQAQIPADMMRAGMEQPKTDMPQMEQAPEMMPQERMPRRPERDTAPEVRIVQVIDEEPEAVAVQQIASESGSNKQTAEHSSSTRRQLWIVRR